VTPRPARYLDGATSAVVPVRVRLAPAGRLQVEGQGLALTYALADVKVRPRLGNTPRAIDLPGGARLEVDDNDAVDAALAETGRGLGARLVAALERHWHSVAVAVLITLAGGAAIVGWGLPAMAKQAAKAVPHEAERAVANHTLEALDGPFFGPSKLTPERAEQVRALFRRVLPEDREGRVYRLLERDGGALGPNAFALPDGTVVITDQLVEKAEDDGELLAVLAHEVGHVVHRHATRQVLQNSAAALLIAVLTGDIVSTSSLAAGLPLVLLQSHYSRAFEADADGYALDWLRGHDVPPRHFADLLTRLEDGTGEAVPGFLASHPATAERVDRFRTP
jgi:Zn-dependent protease with chaperone function